MKLKVFLGYTGIAKSYNFLMHRLVGKICENLDQTNIELAMKSTNKDQNFRIYDPSFVYN